MAEVTNISDLRKDDVRIMMIIEHHDGSKVETNADYFGTIDSITGFIGFWREPNDYPHLVINTDTIKNIRIEEEKVDNS